MHNHRSLPLLVLAALLIPWVGSTAFANGGPIEIQIKVTPSTIVLFAVRNGNWVTVHTDLPFKEVDVGLPVELCGVEAEVLKADNCGNLVAKVPLEGDLREILEAGCTEMTLEGFTADGTPFVGTDTIRIKDTKGKDEKEPPVQTGKIEKSPPVNAQVKNKGGK